MLIYLDSDSDLLEAIADLNQSYEHISPANQKKSKKKKTDDEHDHEHDHQPDPFVVVTEIIISLLSRSSAFLRKIATRSFSLLSQSLPPSAIQSLLDVIDSPEPEVFLFFFLLLAPAWLTRYY